MRPQAPFLFEYMNGSVNMNVRYEKSHNLLSRMRP